MSREITCPVCRHTLSVAGDVRMSWITCPRCLTEVMNPQHHVSASPPTAALPVPVVPMREREPDEPRCPECGEAVKLSWRYCPNCDAPLGRGRTIRQVTSVEQDVRRDTGLAGGGLVLLGLLGGVGIVLFLCGGGLNEVRSRSQAQGIAGIATVIGVVLFGAVVAGMVQAGRAKSSGSHVATTVAGAFAIVILVLAMLLAGMVFLFADCFVSPGCRTTAAPGRER
jgi:hypothetical protein